MADERFHAIRLLYDAFNRRDVDAVLEQFAERLEWPDLINDRVLTDHDAIRNYWQGQFETIDPHVEPVELLDAHGQVAVRVRQAFTSGGKRELGEVAHLYAFEAGQIRRMRVYGSLDEALAAAEVR